MDAQSGAVRLHDRIGDLERERTEEKIIIWTHKVALYGCTALPPYWRPRERRTGEKMIIWTGQN